VLSKRSTWQRARAAQSRDGSGIEQRPAKAYARGMTVHFHEEDLPADVFAPGASVAVDTETMGLLTPRDRLCVVQISDGGPNEHLVRFAPGSDYAAPNLRAVLGDPDRLKLYHFARFDLAAIRYYLHTVAAPVYCTKIASRLIRTYTDRHGLKELVRELLGQEVSKVQQSSDWGAPELSDAQKDYAASDVRFLHARKDKLDARLIREGRMHLAQACFDFLPARAELDLAGWPEVDIFAHA
jgi:ribonuclease D